jgi:hypothetical protein
MCCKGRYSTVVYCGRFCVVYVRFKNQIVRNVDVFTEGRLKEGKCAGCAVRP